MMDDARVVGMHDWRPEGEWESHPGGEFPHLHTACSHCGARAWWTEHQWALVRSGCDFKNLSAEHRLTIQTFRDSLDDPKPDTPSNERSPDDDGVSPIPPGPVQRLGEHLAQLLNDDQWNGTEPFLMDVQRAFELLPSVDPCACPGPVCIRMATVSPYRCRGLPTFDDLAKGRLNP